MSNPRRQGQEEGCSATVLARMYTTKKERKKEKNMVTLFFLFMVLIVLTLAALRWGFDSLFVEA